MMKLKLFEKKRPCPNRGTFPTFARRHEGWHKTSQSPC